MLAERQTAERTTDGTKYRGMARVGVILMGLSLALWVVLPLVPFLPLSVTERAGFAGTQIVVAEVAFWAVPPLPGRQPRGA